MRRYRFLLPLIVPVLLVVWWVVYAWDHVGEPDRVQPGVHPTIFEVGFPMVFSAFVLCAPVFWSGWLYRRDREPAQGAPGAPRSPGSSLPPPPPRPSPPLPPSPF